MVRECKTCYFTGGKKDYSATQWRKGDGESRCPSCTAGGGAAYDSSSSDEDLYLCSACQEWCSIDEFSTNQWSKGEGARRCAECVVRTDKPEQRFKFFHGTSWTRAQKIARDGFIGSSDGLLGPGIYVAREDKARRFAEEAERHGSSAGGLVEVIVSFRNPKYVSSDDTGWRYEGYDACRAETTSRSPNMEWCIKDASQVKVVRIHGPINLRSTECPICKKKSFALLQHAVQHVESGYCSGCPGKDNARQQIYQFAQTQGQQLLGDRAPVVQLDRHGKPVVPDKPYGCSGCGKHFAALSSLMNHKRAAGH
jgi:hypothetical protein